MSADPAAGAKTGTDGLHALFNAFKQQHDSKVKEIAIQAMQGHTMDLTREVLLIRIGDAKFLTTEAQAMGIARYLVTRLFVVPGADAMLLGEFAGALAATVEAIQADKRTTRMN